MQRPPQLPGRIPYALRHNAGSGIYTDGSVQKIQIDHAELQVLGAAAVDALTSRTLYIDVNGGTMGQTITRCELSAIHKGLKMRQENGPSINLPAPKKRSRYGQTPQPHCS